MEYLNAEIIEFEVSGMTCNKCSERIEKALYLIPGVFSVKASHEKGKVVVEYERSKTSWESLQNTINETGYQVENHELRNNLLDE
jgi:copper ion binding protein